MNRGRQDNSKRAYFAAQRQQPTGNYTEFVVRVYYLTLKACGGELGGQCPVGAVRNRRGAFAVYDGIYDHPDHESQSIIENCLGDLVKTGYLSRWREGERELLQVKKPLDFLLEGEHGAYLKKYGIGQPEGAATAKERATENTLPLHTPCVCGRGHYVLRTGKYGPFFGCSRFPQCRSTKSPASLSYLILQREGLRIYETGHICWRCGQSIKLRSYFPHLDLLLAEPAFAQAYDLSVVRLSHSDSLDQYLAGIYPEIQQRYSKKAGFSYMGNTCPHCGGLQGSQMSLWGMYDFLLACCQAGTLEKQVVRRITPGPKLLPWGEWQAIVAAVLED